MTCRQFHQEVDSLVRGDLPLHEQEALQAHASTCASCSELWEDEQRLQKGIMAQTVPEPDDDFESRVRAMALAVFIGMQVGPADTGLPEDIADAPGQTATETVAEPESGAELKTVRLAFNSRKAMDNVTLTLELPPNAELAPFPGRQTISWTVDLKQGDNVLALPINVLFPGSGKLVAHLDDGTRRKTFSTAIPGNTEPSS